MLSNDDIQTGLITYLKGKSTITSLLTNGGANEIRENQWQGTTFAYPNVRVRLGAQYPIASCNCSRMTFGVQVFSESPSSQEADIIAGEVNTQLHNKYFTRNGVRYLVYSVGLIPPIREDDRTWRSEAMFKAIVEPG